MNEERMSPYRRSDLTTPDVAACDSRPSVVWEGDLLQEQPNRVRVVKRPQQVGQKIVYQAFVEVSVKKDCMDARVWQEPTGMLLTRALETLAARLASS